MDGEEVKKEFTRRIQGIKAELANLDKEKVGDFAVEKANQLKEKAQELVDLAREKGTPAIKKTAEDVLESVVKFSKDALKKLEKEKRD